MSSSPRSNQGTFQNYAEGPKPIVGYFEQERVSAPKFIEAKRYNLPRFRTSQSTVLRTVGASPRLHYTNYSHNRRREGIRPGKSPSHLESRICLRPLWGASAGAPRIADGTGLRLTEG